MKEKKKNIGATSQDDPRNKGITLIALIITIIILLILAMVSIRIITDGEIIDHAENAVDIYSEAQEKELINLGYTSYKMAQAQNTAEELTVEGATVTPTGDRWTITFTESGNVYTLNEDGSLEGPRAKTEDENLLEKYFLGGKTLMDVLNMGDMTFIDDPNSITDASTSITALTMVPGSINTDGSYQICLHIKYNNVVYKVTTDSLYTIDSDFVLGENKSVVIFYTPSGREGQTVTYSYDGTAEHEEEWTILYDYGDSVEIISPSPMGSLALGPQDEEAQGTTDIEKAIYSYNNAVNRINNYAASLITNTNKISVRSVGSNPNNPFSDTTTMYTSENLEKWNAAYNGRGKSGDQNDEQDIVRMSYFGVKDVTDTSTNYYYLASREIGRKPNSIAFRIKKNNLVDNGLWEIESDGTVRSYENMNYSVRPVVKINY